MGSDRSLVLDACVAINLKASERWGTIFGACAWHPLMPSPALEEVMYLYDEKGERQDAGLERLVENGELERRRLRFSQIELMISLAAQLGKGEASSIAVARSEFLPLATDDRAARESAGLPTESLFTTAQILRAWERSSSPEEAEVAETLELIESRARFRPRRLDPDFAWWNSRSAADSAPAS